MVKIKKVIHHNLIRYSAWHDNLSCENTQDKTTTFALNYVVQTRVRSRNMINELFDPKIESQCYEQN